MEHGSAKWSPPEGYNPSVAGRIRTTHEESMSAKMQRVSLLDLFLCNNKCTHNSPICYIVTQFILC